MSQFHGLLAVQLSFLSGEHEGKVGVAAPVDRYSASHGAVENLLIESSRFANDLFKSFGYRITEKSPLFQSSAECGSELLQVNLIHLFVLRDRVN